MVIWENQLEVRLERHNRLGKYLGKTHFLALIDLLLTGTRKKCVNNGFYDFWFKIILILCIINEACLKTSFFAGYRNLHVSGRGRRRQTRVHEPNFPCHLFMQIQFNCNTAISIVRVEWLHMKLYELQSPKYFKCSPSQKKFAYLG